MPRGRLPASLLSHSACTSTSLVRHRHHRSGRLHRLLPLSLHLVLTWSVQSIMRDPPGSCDVHHRALHASSSSNKAAGLLLCRLVKPRHRRLCPLRRCIYVVVPCASMTMLRNFCYAFCLHKVVVSLIGSSSSSCRYPRCR
jgi:hypothetical protein